MNKKGFMADFLADFYSFLAYLFILILFFVLFTLTLEGCQGPEPVSMQVISHYNNEVAEELMLLNYLRTEIRGVPMAEMIANASLNNKWRGIAAHTGIIFDEMDKTMYGESKCSIICIDEGNERIMEIETSGCKSYIYGDVCSYNVTIPLYYSKPVRTVTVGLSYDMYTSEYKVPEGTYVFR